MIPLDIQKGKDLEQPCYFRDGETEAWQVRQPSQVQAAEKQAADLELGPGTPGLQAARQVPFPLYKMLSSFSRAVVSLRQSKQTG